MSPGGLQADGGGEYVRGDGEEPGLRVPTWALFNGTRRFGWLGLCSIMWSFSPPPDYGGQSLGSSEVHGSTLDPCGTGVHSHRMSALPATGFGRETSGAGCKPSTGTPLMPSPGSGGLEELGS